VPVYSSIHAMEDRQLDLAVTVSIRNTDTARPIRVETVRYFGNEGQQRGERFAEPQVLGPMATAEVVIPQSKLSGGHRRQPDRRVAVGRAGHAARGRNSDGRDQGHPGSRVLQLRSGP
jgi:hypothetical protein